MNLPQRPTFQPLPCITPSQYNTGLSCRAKVVFGKHYKRDAFPSTAPAILGQAFHAAVELATRGRLPWGDAARRDAVRSRFAEAAREALATAHPYLRERYGRMENLPGFYRQQERAVSLAMLSDSIHQNVGVAVDGAAPPSDEEMPVQPHSLEEPKVEWSVSSRDGLIRGRVDQFVPGRCEIVDYKSGIHDSTGVSDSELRQLRLYAYLCHEQGYEARRGVVVRASGAVDRVTISEEEAQCEGDAAKSFLRSLNADLSAGGVGGLCSPDAAQCFRCAFVPICDRFWEEVSVDWGEASGVFVAGKVEETQRNTGDESKGGRIALRADIHAGNMCATSVTIGPLPIWTSEADGSDPLQPEDDVRVIGVYRREGADGHLGMAPIGSPCVWRIPGGE